MDSAEKENYQRLSETSADFALRYIALLFVTKNSTNLFIRNERLGVNHLLIFTSKLKMKKGTACLFSSVFQR